MNANTTVSNDLGWMSGWQLRAMMEQKQLSPVELMRHVLDRVERYAGDLGAFISVFPFQHTPEHQSCEKRR